MPIFESSTYRMKKTFTFLLLISTLIKSALAQDTSIVVRDSARIDSVQNLYDIVDLFKDINPFKRKDSLLVTKKRSGISILPNINYNPSIGFQVGAKVVGGVFLGDQSTTSMSTFATALNYTTRGIIVGYLAHDTYSADNKWNLKGGLHIAKLVGLDYGLGIGNTMEGLNQEELILNNPDRQRYINSYTIYGLNERLYKQLFDGMFVGAGVFFELKRNIKTLGDFENPPLEIYSEQNKYNSQNYNNNGLMFNVQYMTRDNPNNAFKGTYSDIVLRMGQSWLGSAKNTFQLQTDFRKYWQLSENRPNHVLAFWHWGSYHLGGDKLAYLDLPGTGKDTYARSGRGYTNGYFKGFSFFYSEIEYRFPILRNQFLSGVVFANMQTANDQMGTKLFQQWQPAAGTGLRLLFNKVTRTNLCIDYAFGKFGQRGLFLGLNEAF